MLILFVEIWGFSNFLPGLAKISNLNLPDFWLPNSWDCSYLGVMTHHSQPHQTYFLFLPSLP
jgi:hypothetical protein